MNSVRNFSMRLGLLACCVFVLTAAVTAQKGGKGGGGNADTPVTSTLATSTPSIIYRIESDGQGAYGSSDGVKSIIQTSNTCCRDWELDTKGSTRSIIVDLTDPIAGSAPGGADPSTPWPAGWAAVQARLIVMCHMVNLPGYESFLTMYTTEERYCPMNVTFPVAGSKDTWLLKGEGDHDITDGLVLWAHVTCTSVGTSTCEAWTIDSIQESGELAARGKLWRQPSKGHAAPEDHGDFNLTFAIEVTNP